MDYWDLVEPEYRLRGRDGLDGVFLRRARDIKRYVFSAEKHIVEAIKNVRETFGISASAAISLLITEGYHTLSGRIRMKTTEGTYKCQNCQNLVESEYTNRLFCSYHSEGEYQHETFLDDYCNYFKSKKEGEIWGVQKLVNL